MIYTKDNIQGVKFKTSSSNNIYIIDHDNIFDHLMGIKTSWNVDDCINALNKGEWIPIDKQVINNNYEIY